jgi:hypothetical protein
MISRVVSVLIYFTYVIAAWIYSGGEATVKAAVLLLPLACIWFPESLGNYTGPFDLQPNTSKTPAFFVSAAGWFLLIVVPLIVYVLIA